jgi:predicted amidohydrolase YtcJ
LPTIDLRGGIVLPRFVDVHTHLDKGHIWPRRRNPDGTHSGARAAVAADREAYWNADDAGECSGRTTERCDAAVRSIVFALFGWSRKPFGRDRCEQ